MQRALVLLIVLLLAAIAGGQQVRISFADETSVLANVPSRTDFVAEGVPCRLWVDVIEHTATTLDVSVRLANLGELEVKEYLGHPLRHVHPSLGDLTIPMPIDPDTVTTFGGPGSYVAARGISVGGWHVGIRDGELMGGCKVFADGERIVCRFLETSAESVRPWLGEWGAKAGKGFDPLSTLYPTIPGGRMAAWRIIASTSRDRIDVDPMPKPLASWYAAAGPLSDRASLPPRVRAMLEAFSRSSTRDVPGVGPVASEGPPDAPKSLLWMFGQRERRWEGSYWYDAEGDIWQAHATRQQDSRHFLAAGNLQWADGGSNWHYGLAYSLFRVWLEEMRGTDTNAQRIAWYLATRAIDWSCTSGLVWSESRWPTQIATKGWSFFEKTSGRGPVLVYPGASPDNVAKDYKQFTCNLLPAIALGGAHRLPGLKAHLAALRTMGTEDWRGNNGSGRVAAWGLINALDAWLWTRDASWLPLIAARARAIREIAPEGYHYNPNGLDRRSNVFESAKLIASVMLALSSGVIPEDERIETIEWIAGAVEVFKGRLRTSGRWTLCDYQHAPGERSELYVYGPKMKLLEDGSRVPDLDAQGRLQGGRRDPVGLPDRSEFTRTWALLVVAWAAVVFEDPECEAFALSIWETWGELLEMAPPVTWTEGDWLPPVNAGGGYVIPVSDVTIPGTFTQPAAALEKPYSLSLRVNHGTIKVEAQVARWAGECSFLVGKIKARIKARAELAAR